MADFQQLQLNGGAEEDSLRAFARLLVPSAAFFAGSCNLPGPSAAPSRSMLASNARAISKYVLDDALRREEDSVPLIEALIREFEANKPATRSRKGQKQEKVSLGYTPLQELYTGDDGGEEGNGTMSDEAVWAQMMERVKVLQSWMEPLLGTPNEDDEDAIAERKKKALGLDGEDAESSDEEGADDEDVDFDMNEDGFDLDSDEEGLLDEDEDGADEPSSDDFVERSYSKPLNDLERDTASPSPKRKRLADPDAVEDLSLDTIDSRPSKASRRGGARKKGKSPVDEGFFSLEEFEAEADEGERQMRRGLRRSEDDEDEEGDSDEDVDLFAPIGSAKAGDDEDTDEAEEEDGGPDLSDVADLRYKDFFDPAPRSMKQAPRKSALPNGATPKPDGNSRALVSNAEVLDASKRSKKGRVSFADSVSVKDIPSANRGMTVADMTRQAKLRSLLMKGGALDGDEDEGDDNGMAWASEMLDDDDEDDEAGSDESASDSSSGGDDEEVEDLSESEEGGDADGRTMSRISSDVFDDEESLASGDSGSEDEPADDTAALSRHARRQKGLARQIAELEAQNVAKKEWTMMGEAGARDRPQNSLLEQDLDFEHIRKMVPLVTEEKTVGLEGLIKRRILENDFDDVIRRRPVDMKAFLPSRFLELQDTASSKSLAEVYADEYRDSKARSEGKDVTDVRDAKLEKAHEEITALFETLCGQLDALSNAHFTPKAPKTSITTLANLPAVSLESALPTTSSTATLLAPEEVHSAKPKDVQRDRSKLSHAQKQLERKHRKKARSSLSKAVNKSTGKASTKAQKEESARRLLGTKGVTVIGKESVAKGRNKGGSNAKAPQSSVNLKL